MFSRLPVVADSLDRLPYQLLSKVRSESKDGKDGAGGFEEGSPQLTFDDVCRWLRDADEDLVVKALGDMASERPVLLKRASRNLDEAQQAAEAGRCRELSGFLHIHDRRQDLVFADEPEHDPVVQFTAPVYYCDEVDGVVVLDVIRIGSLSSRSTVRYRTIDGSAESGLQYTSVSGMLVFEPGEDDQTIEIPVRENDQWTTTVEFGVELSIEDCQNSILGKYLWHTRVNVLNKDVFPTSKFKDLILSGQVDQVPKWQLLGEYFKMTCQNPIVRRRSVAVVLIDSLHNWYSILSLFANVYLVDFILNLHSSTNRLLVVQDRAVSLMLLVFCILFPMAILHICDYAKVTYFGVRGRPRVALQTALARKFLNYSAESHSWLKNGDLVMAMMRDAVGLASRGYGDMLEVVKLLGQLGTIVLYQITAPMILNKDHGSLEFYLIFMFPLCMMIFLRFRQATTTRFLDRRNRFEDHLVDAIDETVVNYRLVLAYSRKAQFVDQLTRCALQFNRTNREANQVLLNNSYLAQWLAILSISIYIVVGGVGVLQGTTTLGMFIANINIFKQTGQAWGRIYQIMMQMQSIFPALDHMTVLLNLPTSVPQARDMNKLTRQRSTEAREELLRADSRIRRESDGDARGATDWAPPVDRLPILIEDVAFTYIGNTKLHKCPVNHLGRMNILQGQVVCLVGPLGGGKCTLLKIIGGAMMPRHDVGTFFLPSHLRVVHVSSTPYFFHGTLLANLTFGMDEDDPDAQLERVIAICRRLRLITSKQEDILQYLNSSDEQEWTALLSQTQVHLLGIARALITNPEVLCVEKPTSGLDPISSISAMRLLHNFTRQRGIEQDPERRHLRRPRTAVVALNKLEGIDVADRVFCVSRDKGVREITTEELFGPDDSGSPSEVPSNLPSTEQRLPDRYMTSVRSLSSGVFTAP
eukprot:TRINITY_DN328_c0_g2_i2.p1 TRINITY_DN328_c0_g2~~TRINITY_DN328_c0_g2_i2.p1  ORF type:complete len:926 (+),score=147.58 TRINITY_DN328_c0_g2_i2:51-2828(+)